MTKFQEAIATYNSFMVEKLNDNNVNENVLVALAQMLGDNIFDKDASLVACSDKAELSRVKELYLLKELGLENSPKLDEAIKAVCAKMGASNRKKYRVVFYYLLAQYFGLDSKFGGKTTVEAPKTAKTTAAKAIKAVETTVEKAPKVTKATKIVAETAKVETPAAPAKKATAAKATTETVEAPAATPAKKATTTKKTAAVAATLSFEETVQFYESFVLNQVKYPFYNQEVMVKLAESTGTINEFGNMSIVDVTAEGETERIKANFLQGRLGMENTAELDDAIALVNARMGDLPKFRVPFYYLLTKHTGREWAILQQVEANLY